MLIPHNPSQRLHRSGHRSNERSAELDDVYITIIPSNEPDEAMSSEPARPVRTGRAARMNPSVPPQT